MMRDAWSSVRLSDVCEVRHGFAFPGAHFTDDPSLPTLITPGNFAIGGGFQPTKVKTFSGAIPDEYVLPPGALIVTMTDLSKSGDTLGYSARVPSDKVYLHNQRIGLIVPKPDSVIDMSYLEWVFRSSEYRHHVLASATGSTVRHTSPSRILQYRVAVPPLQVQRAIAGVLRALDDLIEANSVLLAAHLDFALALYEYSFGDRDLSMPLGHIADVVDCLHSKKPERSENGPGLLLQLANIRTDGLLDVTDQFRIAAGDYVRWAAKFETKAWDCVITNVGRVGASALVPAGVVAALGRNMTGLRPSRPQVDGAFLAVSLRSRNVLNEIRLKTDMGSVMDALNVRSIPNLLLPVSEAHERERFHEEAGPHLEFADALLRECQELRRCRDELRPLLMSGRVRPAEVAS